MRMLIFLLISASCLAQGGGPLVRGGDGAVWYHQKEYFLQDGKTFKYITDKDTARYFNPGEDKYEITVTARKITTVPVPITVEAESATSLVNASIDPNTGGTTICCINPNAVILYTNKTFSKQTKLRIRYARANAGNGQLTFRIGSTSIPVSFPPTGSWSTWQELTVSIEPIFEGSQPVQILSTMQGPCNLDYFVFE